MSKKHMGSSIDDFLREEGIFEEAQAQAVEEVVAWQVAGGGPNKEPTITFTLRGKTFEKCKEDFVKATEGLEPARAKKYSTVINGKRYPIRQVLSAVTKLAAAAITSQDAYRVLKKFELPVDTEAG
jgi:hypothetical protein